MCTAIGFRANHYLFGRTLDLDRSYGESVAILPRNMPLRFRREGTSSRHLAMIGTAHISDGIPLYYDAVNEKGLACAALHFPMFCQYAARGAKDRHAIYPFEAILWLLHQCENLAQAKALMQNTCILQGSFSQALPSTPLHWIVSDKTGSFIVEAAKDGLSVTNAPCNVLTNSPDYARQLENLCKYRGLSNQNRCSEEGSSYCLGTGAIGLPGDYSSPSRFVKAEFLLRHSEKGSCIEEDVLQFFRIMVAVSPPRGSVKTKDNADHCTVYTGCCDTQEAIYYYTTYESSRIRAIDMKKENLNGSEVIAYPMCHGTDILPQN